jgi:hypothetical protein
MKPPILRGLNHGVSVTRYKTDPGPEKQGDAPDRVLQPEKTLNTRIFRTVLCPISLKIFECIT